MKETMKKTPERNYKDRMFRMVFKDRKELLSLYNAINNTSYDNPEALEVNTLENVIYLNMKNDLSFVIDSGYLCMSISQPIIRIFPLGIYSMLPICMRRSLRMKTFTGRV